MTWPITSSQDQLHFSMCALKTKRNIFPAQKLSLYSEQTTGDVCWQGEDRILLHRYFEDACQANSQAQHTDRSVVLHVWAAGVWEQGFHDFSSAKASWKVFEETRVWNTGGQPSPAWENCLGLQVLPVISYATLYLVLQWLGTCSLLLVTSFYFRTWKSLFQWWEQWEMNCWKCARKKGKATWLTKAGKPFALKKLKKEKIL